MTKILMNIVVILSLTTIGQAGNLGDFEKKCTSGDGDACATLGAVYSGLAGKGSVKKDMQKAAAFWKKGCDLNSGSSCATYSMVIEDDNERIKVLKKACDLGNENGCLAHDQTVMMQTLQMECAEKQDMRSCGKLGSEVFISGEYSKGKDFLNDVCEEGDAISCSDLKIIEESKGFTKLSAIEDLKKKCSDKKDKFACEKAGNFLIGVNSYVMSLVKTEAEKKAAVPEVMTNLMIGQLYISEACKFGRKESCRTLKGLEAAQKKSKGGK